MSTATLHPAALSAHPASHLSRDSIKICYIATHFTAMT
jgi:hypothetical protein